MGTLQERFSISAVIPTLNAAETLSATLDTLWGSGVVREITVADGGSSDETVDRAGSAGARVVIAPCGRGVQLAAGAAAAPEAGSRAGYFDLALDDPAPVARRLEHIVAWRCRVLALPYGDQGLLISRTLYDNVGGFAPLPLMEDVDFVRRLGRRRLTRIGARCIASARRYRRDGYLRRSLRNLVCLSLYFGGVPPARIARLYR